MQLSPSAFLLYDSLAMLLLGGESIPLTLSLRPASFVHQTLVEKISRFRISSGSVRCCLDIAGATCWKAALSDAETRDPAGLPQGTKIPESRQYQSNTKRYKVPQSGWALKVMKKRPKNDFAGVPFFFMVALEKDVLDCTEGKGTGFMVFVVANFLASRV